MGRPPKAKDAKRQLIGARFNPEARRRIEQHAKIAGRSPGAEVERRVSVTLGLDDRGLDLIEAIATEVQAIQTITGRAWHRDMTTWYAVVEMLRAMPPWNWHQIHDDDPLEAMRQQLLALCEERRTRVDELAATGIPVPELPDQENADGVLLGNTRANTKAVVTGFTPSPARDRALALLDEVINLDQEIERHGRDAAKWSTPYIEHAEAGQALYRRRLQAEARRRRDEGLPYDPRHLNGDFE